MRAIKLFLLLALLALTAGCATFPSEELRLYSEAFQETKAAGNILLDKVSPIIASVETGKTAKDNCGPDVYGVPRCFDNRIVRAGDLRSDPRSIAVRRIALDLIAAYNGLLVDLAEGKGVPELQSRIANVIDLATEIMALTGVAGPLPALLPVARPLMLKFIERMETARTAAVARESIAANRETIQALLKLLEDDTPVLYRIYRIKRTDDRRRASLNDDDAGVQAAINDIKQFHASLTVYVVLLRKTSKALEMLAVAAAQPPQTDPHSLRAVIREAVEIRAEAKKFWETIRTVQASR